MGRAQKELQEQLLNVGNRILAPPSSVDELLPLLDQAETFLSRVQQSPSNSMIAALHPAMAGLTAKRLLRHSDTDVKVAVASCISEITRITAPEAPYEDDLMKEVFEMIVEAFQKLEDISSRSYLKRVSILETVAKVRSFVVMLDLECDSLIFKMFHHFLSTIRDNHPENVFSSMEMIMTLVLEESEDISSDLLSCLLMSVKKNSKDILPIARKLAEKVIGNCASKLKPSLMEAVQSMGALLDDYSEIVAFTCQGISEVLEQNGVIVSGECLAGDSKVSERVLSDEMPQMYADQVSQKVESEIACPNVSAATNKLPRSSVSNGTVQRNDNTLVEPTSPRKKTEHSCRGTLPRNETAAGLEAEKVGTALDRDTKKARGQKGNSAVQPTGNTHHPPLGASELPGRRKGRGREANLVPLEKPTDNSASVITAADNGKIPDSNHSKRGRSLGSKISMKKVGTSPAGNGNIKDEPEPYMDIGVKKQTEVTGGSEKKPLRRSGKKGRFENVDNGGKSNSYSDAATDAMSDPEEKLHRRPGRKPQTKMANEDEASGKHWTLKTKQQKGRVSSEEIVVDEPKQKGMISSTMTTPTTKAKKDQNLSEEGLKTKSRKKRARQEISETPRNAIKYDESLVGVKINVWWPVDAEFYLGVVDSYNPATMKHKVLYMDGDEEDLLLEDEILQFFKGEKEEEGKCDSTPEAAEMPRKKANLSDSSAKKSNKVVSSSNSRGSADKVSANGTKPGRKRRLNSAESTGGGRAGSSKTDGSTPTESMSKERKGRIQNVDMPKHSILSEDEWNSKSKDESPRASKTEDNAKPGRKSKSDTPSKLSGSKDDAASTPGLTGPGGKLKPSTASPGKSRSKSDANGSAKVKKSGSSKQVRTEHGTTKVKSNARVLLSQGSGEKSGKKRRKKSES